MSARLTAAALQLAATGLHVFPCSRSKVPCVERGFRDATRDPDAIGEAFSRRGAALIGVATGASGLVVVDVDAKEGSDGRLWVFEHAHRLPVTRVHRTPSGGAHWMFVAHSVNNVPCSNSRLARGVDVRGRGGYVVWPGTEGDGYTVARDVAPAVLPLWLAEACQPPLAPQPPPILAVRVSTTGLSRYGAAALRRACERIARAGFGAQESTLNSEVFSIGRLVGAEALPDGEAFRALCAAGLNMPSQPGREPWTAAAVERRVRKALDAGKAKPRPMPALSSGGRAHAG